MPTAPITTPSAAVPPSVPPPICLGVPVTLWAETFRNEEDVRQYWLGHTLGGAICAGLLIIEIVTVFLLFDGSGALP